METVKASVAGLDSTKDLKPLLSAQGPCLSIYMPLAATPPGQAASLNPLRWREMLDTLNKEVEIWGVEGRELLQSVSDFESLVAQSPGGGKSIAILRSPEVFRVVWLQHEVPQQAGFGPQFQIRPLLSELTRGKSLYLLALSQGNVRLLHCTLTHSEEVQLGEGVATNFDKYMNSTEPDHARVRGGSVGPSGGSARTTASTTTSERESRDEYLLHFFQQIDKSVSAMLKGNTEPLVTVGVEYEQVLYRRVNSYPHLLDEGVHGAANGLKAGEMHARALALLDQHYESKVDEILAEYNHKVGSGASNRLKDVVLAAHEGRILHLVVSDQLSPTGTFDPDTYQVSGGAKGGTQDQDLVNDAAVQTLLHAGNVFVTSNKKLPQGSPVAAVFRYQAAAH